MVNQHRGVHDCPLIVMEMMEKDKLEASEVKCLVKLNIKRSFGSQDSTIYGRKVMLLHTTST